MSPYVLFYAPFTVKRRITSFQLDGGARIVHPKDYDERVWPK